MEFAEAQNMQLEQEDPDMVRILETMLEADEKITARGVVKQHPKIRHASSITRDPHRSELLARYQASKMSAVLGRGGYPNYPRRKLLAE